ncbi:hypothetical protein HMPREF0262_02346 [Clostridium sp. ATCC 29733]|nr:hypothetical protein HMPREF0262_02346 [Clostridium sp. ATCC 29733]
MGKGMVWGCAAVRQSPQDSRISVIIPQVAAGGTGGNKSRAKGKNIHRE